ncbi:MAG: YbbR-like domain-containing protein, partial [Ruminococcus sp.]
IKVSASYSGTPAPGYEVEKITTTPETISVAGSEEALVKLAENGNTVEIPASLINVEGSNQDLEANIKLNSLLKEEDGFKIPENMTQSLLVRVSILPYGSKEFEVDTSDIIISGLGENLKVMFTQGSVIVRVKGTEADLEQLKAKDIKASVDLTDKVAGEYSVPVTVKLPEGYEQVENTLATIQLAKTENTKE